MDEGRKGRAPLDRNKRDSSSNIIPGYSKSRRRPPHLPVRYPNHRSKQGVAFLAALGGQAMIDKDQAKQTIMTTNCGIMIETRMRNILYAALRSQARMNFETQFDARSLAWRRPILL